MRLERAQDAIRAPGDTVRCCGAPILLRLRLFADPAILSLIRPAWPVAASTESRVPRPDAIAYASKLSDQSKSESSAPLLSLHSPRG